MKRPNPLSPRKMTPRERRAELCSILALGVIRLKMREAAQLIEETGDFPLHKPCDQSGSADMQNRRSA